MALAARGARHLDTGVEKIGDVAVAAQIRRQARKVHLKSLGAAAALTAATLMLPGGD